MTAIADGLAGFAVAGAPDTMAIRWILAATSCLYAGGVTLNDFFDRELDSRERPERPIPSGRVRPAAAAFLGVVLLSCGVLAATQASAAATWIAVAISGFVLLYDTWGKHRMFIGPLNMGVCRGLNLLLGISSVPAAIEAHWYLAFLPLIYVCGITALSRGEVHGGKRPVAILSLVSLALVLAALIAIIVSAEARPWWAAASLALFAWRVLPPFIEALRRLEPSSIRNAVRTGVLSLVLLDAVIGGAFGGVLYCLLILATAVLAMGLAKLFAVT